MIWLIMLLLFGQSIDSGLGGHERLNGHVCELRVNRPKHIRGHIIKRVKTIKSGVGRNIK